MTPEWNSTAWYAIQTRKRREQSTATLLSGKGYEIFLPVRSWEHRRDRQNEEVRPTLFPGYLFCCFDVRKRVPILVTPGVVGVVGQGRVPIPVPFRRYTPSRAWFPRECMLNLGLTWNADKESRLPIMLCRVSREFWLATRETTES